MSIPFIPFETPFGEIVRLLDYCTQGCYEWEHAGFTL
jgi:hypothetical protein